ncbi:MAG: hypothetical protein ACRCYQ_06605 [Nocardioides sp.]
MPLVGESSWFFNSSSLYHSFTRSADIDIPPSAAFLKVFLGGSYGEDDETNAAGAYIKNIRFRNQNGVDQTVNFIGDQVKVQYNPTLTHATIAAHGINGFAELVWTLGYWA